MSSLEQKALMAAKSFGCALWHWRSNSPGSSTTGRPGAAEAIELKVARRASAVAAAKLVESIILDAVELE